MAATNLGDTYILIAEATVKRNIVKRAIELGYKKILIKGDNKIPIQTMRGEIYVLWRIHTLVQDIKCFISQAT